MIWIVIKSVMLLQNYWPLRWEVKNDAYGEVKPHPNYDWERRTVLCGLVGLAMALVSQWNVPWEWWFIWHVFKYSCASAGIFIAIFPYVINYVHLKNRVTHYKIKGANISYGFLSRKEKFSHVVNHLSDSAVPDRLKIWRSIGWIGRSLVYMAVLGGSILIWYA